MLTIKSNENRVLGKAAAERFWSQVGRDANPTRCWPWLGSKNSKGYGRFFVGGKHQLARRLAWRLAGRAIQSDLAIRDTCGNRACVNPDHLVMGADAGTTARAGKRGRAKKPHKDFPLHVHATGRWAKKVRGKLVYFGSTKDDAKGEKALALWLEQKDELLAGRTPRVSRDGLNVCDLVNRFLTAKRLKVESGELKARSFADYYRTCERVVGHFGRTRHVADLAGDDFAAFRAALAKTLGPVALGNEVQRSRVLFKFAKDNDRIEVSFGSEFKRPAKMILRKARREAGLRMFEADELRCVVAAASQPLRAMILLGVNCGFGNADVGTLPMSAVNLDSGWVNYHRPKTEVLRRCPLWPETVKALRDWLKQRPVAKEPASHELVFLTRCGAPWHKGDRTLALDSADAVDGKKLYSLVDNPVSKEMRKLLRSLSLHRPGLGFYALRHTFETIGGGTRDQVAVDVIMGHDRGDMASVYRERIDDDRLLAVVNHVRAWLFPSESKAKKKSASKTKASQKRHRRNRSLVGRRRRAASPGLWATNAQVCESWADPLRKKSGRQRSVGKRLPRRPNQVTPGLALDKSARGIADFANLSRVRARMARVLPKSTADA
jgi:integrase